MVSYEELNQNFEATVQVLSSRFEQTCGAITRPGVRENVVGKGEGKIGTYRQYLNDDDLDFVSREVGDLMDRLGYPH